MPVPTCGGTGQTMRSLGGFTPSEPCRHCRRSGQVVDDPCRDCRDTGRAATTRTVTTRIPPGVRDGQRIRIRGRGTPGQQGGPPGDLCVVVRVGPHPVFGRNGDDLTVTAPVSFPEAALGAEIKVPTLGGAPVTLRLPAGTVNGRTFRVHGRGAPRSPRQP